MAVATLRVVESDGTVGDWLTDWSGLSFTVQEDSEHALSFTYPTDGANVDKLEKHRQVVLLLDGQEPKNGRFVVESWSGNRIGDDRLKREWPMIGLTKATQWGMFQTPDIDKPGRDQRQTRSWENHTPGQIIMDEVDNPAGRDVFDWWGFDGYTFDADKDSNGNDWAMKVEGLNHKYSQPLRTLLEYQFTRGYAEIGSWKNKLEAFNWRQRGKERDGINLLSGRHIADAPEELDWSDYATDITVTGQAPEDESGESEADREIAVLVSADERPYGRFEKQMSIGGDDHTVAELRKMGEQQLKVYEGEPKSSRTYKLVNDMSWTPMLDFDIGDTVWMHTGGWLQERISVISGNADRQGLIEWTVTAPGMLSDRNDRLDRLLKKFEGEEGDV